MEDPELAVRREVCSAIYRLCLGVSAKGETLESTFIAPMLSQLLSYLEKAERMRPPKIEVSFGNILVFNNNKIPESKCMCGTVRNF